MRGIGIDLAASARTTAAAVVVWGAGGVVVEPPRVRCNDDDLLGLLSGMVGDDRAGVDCPFGWPTEFVRAVAAHAEGASWPGRALDRGEHYRSLRLRLTDRRVQEECGLTPLSVSFDKLGATAARWAFLADALAADGRPVDRAGGGAVVEVYPAASRKRWGLDGRRDVGELLRAAPWLGMDQDMRSAYEANEHAFDALVAALTARAAACGRTGAPSAADRPVAEREGWVHLPEVGSLGALG